MEGKYCIKVSLSLSIPTAAAAFHLAVERGRKREKRVDDSNYEETDSGFFLLENPWERIEWRTA